MNNNAKKVTVNQALSGKNVINCGIMLAKISCEYITMAKTLPLKDVSKTLSRKSKRVDARFKSSDRGQELLSKASHYKIPVDRNNLNWFELIDEVARYEMLLEDAHDLGIEWDISYYDVIGLEQEIEHFRDDARAEQHELYHSYYNPVTLGV